MRLRQTVAVAFAALSIPRSVVADESIPGFVADAIEILSPDLVLPTINTWARKTEAPAVCRAVRVDLPNSQDWASDGIKTAIVADVERDVLWVELVRGLDGRLEYRGPVQVSEDGDLITRSQNDLAPCEAPDALDAA